MKVKLGEEVEEKVRCRIRFDFPGYRKPGRFIFGSKDTFEVAEEQRDNQVTNWQNVPIQGVEIDHIEQKETYAVYVEELDEDVAYAPVELTISADSLVDLLPFIMREEFRKIELHNPLMVNFTKTEIEKFLGKVNEELTYRLTYERRKQES
ncbi:hypothetical protein [Natranaerobius trueperi]|uniref:Uncharacterized protein n=1 Tax=Natranaerobius trueperi TaxID=759412 RepID=A0A226BXL0_9FIRM|nr:hypothetical protein [Natranaerobius trueperi]OWZ82939.1 hypothetical protein CDO51_11190 [Natranaerobius trueperi]